MPDSHSNLSVETGAVQSYRYDEENRMTEAGNVRYEYTETGGVQREIGTVHELVYSYRHQRVSGITGNLPGGEQVEVSYGYDALGRRTSRQDSSDDRAIRTVYEGLSMNSVMTLETDRVFAEGITGAGTNRNTGSAGTGRYRRSDGPGAGLARPASLETRTVRMGRDAVAQMTGGPEGEITFYGHDILGSVTARFSDRGELVEELEYRAFGELRRGELTAEHPYGYTGKPVDPATGIYDYGFRDYAPELARFTTVDPIRDGNNWYAYVGNDPVNFVDPLGLLAARPGDGVAEVPTTGNRYIEGTTSFRYTQVDYAAVEGLGLTSSYTVSGNVTISENADATYTARVTALGYSAGASQAGVVDFSGEVRITSDGKMRHVAPLRPPTEPSIFSQSSQMIGTTQFLLPPEDADIDFEVTLSATYNVDMGSSRYSPIPMNRALPIFQKD